MYNLNKDSILSKLNYPISICIESSVSSTNEVLKDIANKGETEGYVLISKHQTNGKGRLNRQFFSENGLYFSILLRPDLSLDNAVMITVAAAVAVAKAIDKVCKKPCQIKWVNDIFLNDKKICGILTESKVKSNSQLEYAILGIGINILPPKNDFPNDIKHIAGTLFENESIDNETVNSLIAEIINTFFDYYQNLTNKDYMPDYKNLSYIIGKKINIIQNNKSIPATAVDIDDNAQLIAKLSDGTKTIVSSGEISIRLA